MRVRGRKAIKRELHLGPVLRALRWPDRYDKAQMSQAELAEELGVSPALVCKWEAAHNGYHPNDEDLIKICEIFGKTREDLERMAREIVEWRKGGDEGKPAQAA